MGVGFGPANMALGALLEEAEEAEGLRYEFLEAREAPCWHPGMLLQGSMLQVTVLKDLVTIRDPRSRFTFLNYLKDQDRLFEFLNLRDLFPCRAEFNHYLTWVADQLSHRVRFGREVMGINPVPGRDGGCELLEVRSRRRGAAADEPEERLLARNVVVATGGTPWAPDGIEVSNEGPVIHSHQFLSRIHDQYPDRDAPYRFVVVGGGQSGAELFLYLMEHFPNARVTAALRRFAYKPVDESDFTNTIFFPEMVDFVYDLPPERRKEVIDSFRDVNYAVVDHPLIRRIYRAIYDEKVVGKERAKIHPFLGLQAIRQHGDGVVAEFEELLKGGSVEMEADGLILATGYRWSTRHRLLEGLAPHLQQEADGEYVVERDYSIAPRDGFEPRVYLQGYCERTHGIGETVLSLLPMRAEDIWKSILRRRVEGRGEPALAGAPA
ncbi:MAG: SidA/IucD/PvdA family monooxygenase [Acidobacteriota bacterium]|nr:SidA/IucD/PvdA family monooxygenase [Acidobacteriota bacterium]